MASINSPLPLGHDQTASQPLTIALMLEQLQPLPGHKVLEIGYGSGWVTALLAKIVCKPKKDTQASKNKSSKLIQAYEIVPELAEFGEENLNKNLQPKFRKIIELHDEDYSKTFQNYSPYDRIIAGAAFNKQPTDLIKSLKVGGRFVFPTSKDDIRRIIKESKKKYTEEIYPGFTFVPITHRV